MNDLIKLKLVTEDEAECLHRLQVEAFMPLYESKRQIMRQSLNSTPPVMGGAASGIRPEDYLTMA